MTLRSYLVPGLALACLTTTAPAAERPGFVPAGGMALTTPWQGMALVAKPGMPEVTGFRRAVIVRPADPAPFPGRLPNQHTGPKRDRAVHDICIGC